MSSIFVQSRNRNFGKRDPIEAFKVQKRWEKFNREFTGDATGTGL
jgi:hypothetical protein